MHVKQGTNVDRAYRRRIIGHQHAKTSAPPISPNTSLDYPLFHLNKVNNDKEVHHVNTSGLLRKAMNDYRILKHGAN